MAGIDEKQFDQLKGAYSAEQIGGVLGKLEFTQAKDIVEGVRTVQGFDGSTKTFEVGGESKSNSNPAGWINEQLGSKIKTDEGSKSLGKITQHPLDAAVDKLELGSLKNRAEVVGVSNEAVDNLAERFTNLQIGGALVNLEFQQAKDLTEMAGGMHRHDGSSMQEQDDKLSQSNARPVEWITQQLEKDCAMDKPQPKQAPSWDEGGLFPPVRKAEEAQQAQTQGMKL